MGSSGSLETRHALKAKLSARQSPYGGSRVGGLFRVARQALTGGSHDWGSPAAFRAEWNRAGYSVCGTGCGHDHRPTGPSQVTEALRQSLTDHGVTVLGILVQPGLIYPDDPRSHPPPVKAIVGLSETAVLAGEMAEQGAVLREYRAKMAAARICAPRAVLGMVLRGLRQEQRSRLAVLREKAATRRNVRQAEDLTRRFRQAAWNVAQGVRSSPTPEAPEATSARILAAILCKL